LSRSNDASNARHSLSFARGSGWSSGNFDCGVRIDPRSTNL
jgi:hypothetical protein